MKLFPMAQGGRRHMVYRVWTGTRISSQLKWYKNYKNRLRLAKLTVKNKMSRFFMVHCVHEVELRNYRNWLLLHRKVADADIMQLSLYSFIHSFICFRQLRSIDIYIKTYIYIRTRKTDREKKNTHRTRRTISLSQTDSLLAKLTLELCIRVLKLGSPRSNSFFVTLLYFGYPKKNTWYI